MIMHKVRHGRRFTTKVLANGKITYTGTSTDPNAGIVCTATIMITDPSEPIYEGFAVTLTETELRTMLHHIEQYNKHFNDDGSVKP